MPASGGCHLGLCKVLDNLTLAQGDLEEQLESLEEELVCFRSNQGQV